MNVKKKPQSAMIGPNLINQAAYGIVILVEEWPSVGILECAFRRAAVGIDEGAIEVSDDNVWRFSEDIKQHLGYFPGDRASKTVGVFFEPAVGGQPHPCAGVRDAGRLLIAAVRAGEDHRQCALVMADQISLFITDSSHRFTPSPNFNLSRACHLRFNALTQDVVRLFARIHASSSSIN